MTLIKISMSKNNVTMIDDLPYLEELEKESFQNGVPASELKQIQKFIRNTQYNPPMESGMNPNYNNNYPPPPPIQRRQQSAIIDDEANSEALVVPQPVPIPSAHQQHHHHRILSLSCIDVAEHTANCIVCSRLYNTDTTLYIIVICILLLFSAILFKKVLDLQQRV